MDITRNWRLKTSRSHLLATRCPETGAVLLPQQTGHAINSAAPVYTYQEELAPASEGEAEYAQAAR